jgi:hypothetical protein
LSDIRVFPGIFKNLGWNWMLHANVPFFATLTDEFLRVKCGDEENILSVVGIERRMMPSDMEEKGEVFPASFWRRIITGPRVIIGAIAAILLGLTVIKGAVGELVPPASTPELVLLERNPSSDVPARKMLAYAIVIRNRARSELIVASVRLKTVAVWQGRPALTKAAPRVSQSSGPVTFRDIYDIAPDCPTTSYLVSLIPPYRIAPNSSAAFQLRIANQQGGAHCPVEASFVTDHGETGAAPLAADSPSGRAETRAD